MTRYLIDIRQMGAVKRQISALSRDLQETFDLGTMLVVPHITLAGPFSTDDENRLVHDFAQVCGGQEEAPHYEVGGYGFFEKTRVVFVEITPDEALRQFRYRLAQAIVPYCILREYDRVSAEEFRFHSTLAMKLNRLTFLRIKWHFRHQEPVSPWYPPDPGNTAEKFPDPLRIRFFAGAYAHPYSGRGAGDTGAGQQGASGLG